MQFPPQSARRSHAEAGFVLIAVLFLVALILIGLAVAAPRIAKSIQRDKELELVHRGEQYKRAIRLYYRKFGAYPSSIDQLMNSNNIRFLRKRYTDPFTGKDDWKVIYFGQAHVKTMGLFGQPIANTGTAGSNALGGTGTAGPGNLSGGALGGSTLATGGIAATGADGSTSSGTDSSGNSTSSGTNGSATGSALPGGAGAFGSNTTGNTNPLSGGSGPIVGVKIPDTRASLKEYKQQKHYNEWEFVYDPLEDQMQAGTMFGGATQNLNGATPGPGVGGANGIGGATNGGGINSGQGGTTNGGSTGPATPQQ